MDISASIRKLATLFIALFIALSAGLVYWQVVVAQQVTSNIHNGRHCLPDSAPIRGRILDRNGMVLAESTKLGPCGYVRHYTDPSLASLIGYYVSPSYPATGLEAKYDDFLSGRVGVTSLSNTVNQTLHRPPVGDDIYLTIDEHIQKIASKDFNMPITIDNRNTFQSDRGSVIITNPKTGEVLAMVSSPTYNPNLSYNDPNNHGYDPNHMVQTLLNGDLSYFKMKNADKEQPLLERPIQGLYVPGSTYKTMTLMAGLDSGHTNLNEPFDKDHALGTNNAVVYNGQVFGPVGNNLTPYTFRFPVTTEYGYTHSDNIIFAQIGVHTGASTWLDYNNRFYVGRTIPFDLPVQPSSVLPNGKQTLVNNELAAGAFGQGTDFVTPMQMLLLDNVAANNGQLMRPMLVARILDPSKTPVQTNTPQLLSTPISQQTATEVRQGMYGVVRCGSGSLTEVNFVGSPWGIIGKTGTAEVGGNKPAHGWLITSAPYDINNPSQLPALTIVAMKENGGEGGAAVGPAIAAMYNDIFTTVMKDVPMPPAPSRQYCCNTKLLQLGCAP